MKLRAKDLRIGNLVDMKYKNFIAEGHHWTTNYIKMADLMEMEAYPECYKPIPLSEQWLIDFGFKLYQNTRYLKHNNFDLSCSKDGQKWGLNRKYETIPIFIKYVHQLQNLFFALTGEELTLPTL